MFRKLYLILLFSLSTILLFTSHQLVGSSGIYLFIRNISVIALIISLLPKKVDLITSSILLFLITLYVSVQSVYFRAFDLYGLSKTLWSIKTDLTQYTTSITELITVKDFLNFIIPILYFIFTNYGLRKITFINKKEKYYLRLILIFVLLLITSSSQFIFVSNLNKSKTDDVYLLRSTDYYIYYSVESGTTFVNHFGLFNLMIRDISSYFFIPYSNSLNIEEEITSILQSNTTIQTSSYSGIFEGKSLILIEAESLNNFAIDPVLTPTLYKLKNEGIFIEGYNSPLLTGSTSDSEFLVNTSLFPAFNGNIVFNDYADNVFPQTLANNFTNSGYYSMAAHNNLGWFYNRTVMMPNLGFVFFDPVGMGLSDHVEDSTVLDYIKWITYGMDKSFTFYITYNAHQPYSEDSLTDLMLPYLTKVQNYYPKLSLAEQVYLAKNMDFDAGLEKLLVDYQNAGVLNNTVIMIYGDHYPKGLFEVESDYEQYCSKEGMSLDVCFDTPLIIYNSEIEGNVVAKISSTLDIAPTIYDLFSLSYDSFTTLGHSVFDPSYEGFYFSAWDIVETDHYTYDSARDTISMNDNKFTYDEALDDARRLFYEYSTLRNIVPLNYFDSEIYKETFVNAK